MPESLYQTVGGASFPAVATQITDGLQSLDPKRDLLLAFFEAVINAELGGAWGEARTNSGATGLATTPVGSSFPMLPAPDIILQRKNDWPALFLGRNLEDPRNRFEEFSIWQTQQVQIWGLHYIIPPLTVGGRRKLEDVIVRVVQACHLAIKNMHHPAYQSGAFWMAPAGISSLRLLNFRAGDARFSTDDGPTYLAMTMTLESVELSGHVDGTGVPITDIAIRAGTGNADGIIPVLVEGISDVHPQG